MSQVEVVLDPITMVLYRCQPKTRRFVNFRDFPNQETDLESTAFCGVCSDSDCVIAGYKFRHPKDQRLVIVVTEIVNRDLVAALRAMLALDALALVTPHTPNEMLRLVKGGNKGDRTDLAQWVGDEAFARIEDAEPPETDRVFAFLRAQGIYGIYDSRQDGFTLPLCDLDRIAAFAVRAGTSDEVRRHISSLTAPRED